MYDFDWKELYKLSNFVKKHLNESFPYITPVGEERFLENIKNGRLFGHVQCEIQVPEIFRENFCQVPSNLQEQKRFQRWHWPASESIRWIKSIFDSTSRMLISRYFLETGAVTTPSFIWIRGWCAKIIPLYSTLKQSASAILANLQRMLEERKRRESKH